MGSISTTSRKRKSTTETVKAKTVKAEEKIDVVGSTLDDEKDESKSGSDVVMIAVSLRCGHKFDDVPNGNGGTKVVRLAGVDDRLRGAGDGILSPDGNCVFQTLKRQDWEAILAMHGREAMFLGVNGHTPCVFEVKGCKTKDQATKSYKDEIKNMATGFAPIVAEKEGVIEAKQTD